MPATSRDPRVFARRTTLVFAVGVVLAIAAEVASRFEQAAGTAVSGSWIDLARDAGLAATAFGAIVLLADVVAPPVRRAFVRLARPLADMGTMALTVYCLHVLVLMWLWGSPLLGPEGWLRAGEGAPASARYAMGPALVVMIGLVVLCAAFAMVWRRWLGTGPLERVLGVVTLRHPPASLFARQRR